MKEIDARQAIEKLALIILNRVEAKPITVGLSGGADSTLALLVAKRLEEINPLFKVKAVHCIHGLDASDPIWLAHCIALCQKLDIPLVTPKLNIVYGNGVSPEDISRQERYRALLLNMQKGGYLLFGHQKDDQVENFLLALKRGSGPRGLSGMRYVIHDNRGTILRPLLDLTKKEIKEILVALGYSWQEDESNEYLKFERNFFRLKVLPLMRERFKGIDEAIFRSAKLCSYEHDLAERYMYDIFVSRYNEKEQSFNFANLDLNDEALVISLLRKFWLTKCLLSPDLKTIRESYNLLKVSRDQKGQIYFENIVLYRYLNKIYLRSKELLFPTKTDNFNLKLNERKLLGSVEYSLILATTDDNNSFYINENDSLNFSFNYTGQTRLKPVTRTHSREIKKLMQEYDVPWFERNSIALVRKGEEVIAFSDLFVTNKGKGSILVKIQRKIMY